MSLLLPFLMEALTWFYRVFFAGFLLYYSFLYGKSSKAKVQAQLRALPCQVVQQLQSNLRWNDRIVRKLTRYWLPALMCFKHTHTITHVHTRTHSRTGTPTHSHTHTHMNVHLRTHARTRVRADTRTRAHVRLCKLTYNVLTHKQ